MNLSSEAKVLLSIATLSMALLIGAVFFLSKSPQNPQSPQTKVDQSKLIKTDSHKIGSDSAKIKLVEFGDFQCPACKMAFPTVEKLRLDYKDNLQFIFRHFPLPQHKNAVIAAKAAEAAAEQGKFEQMYEKLYENQNDWVESDDPKAIFSGYATDLGLDSAKFEQTLNSNKFEDKINSDRSDGNSLGVNSTPTFYINGQKYQGAFSYRDFQSELEKIK